MSTDSTILKFYLKIDPDVQGRTLDFIWQQDYVWLEKTHDYIQWLFPLPERSRFNPHAPILTETDIQSFKASQNLKQNLLCSLKVMLGFYGLRFQEPSLIISTNIESFTERKQAWLHWGNHNHMRITRILKSLKFLGLGEYANSLFDCLEQIYIKEKENVTKLTFSHWKDAVENTK